MRHFSIGRFLIFCSVQCLLFLIEIPFPSLGSDPEVVPRYLFAFEAVPYTSWLFSHPLWVDNGPFKLPLKHTPKLLKDILYLFVDLKKKLFFKREMFKDYLKEMDGTRSGAYLWCSRVGTGPYTGDLGSRSSPWNISSWPEGWGWDRNVSVWGSRPCRRSRFLPTKLKWKIMMKIRQFMEVEARRNRKKKHKYLSKIKCYKSK